MHPAEFLLEYLERCEPHNGKWQRYIIARTNEVSAWVLRLRVFAARNPDSNVSRIVTVRANGLQSRLDVVLGNL